MRIRIRVYTAGERQKETKREASETHPQYIHTPHHHQVCPSLMYDASKGYGLAPAPAFQCSWFVNPTTLFANPRALYVFSPTATEPCGCLGYGVATEQTLPQLVVAAQVVEDCSGATVVNATAAAAPTAGDSNATMVGTGLNATSASSYEAVTARVAAEGGN